MKRSTDRILTTHVGSLVRTPAILRGVKAHVTHEPYNDEQFASDVQTGIADVVRKQAEIGIDIPSDGEVRRENYIHYHCRHMQGIDFQHLTRKTMGLGWGDG